MHSCHSFQERHEDSHGSKPQKSESDGDLQRGIGLKEADEGWFLIVVVVLLRHGGLLVTLISLLIMQFIAKRFFSASSLRHILEKEVIPARKESTAPHTQNSPPSASSTAKK
jgi:hypothetical protein